MVAAETTAPRKPFVWPARRPRPAAPADPIASAASAMAPTTEQQAIVTAGRRLAKTRRGTMKILAYAGCGKTTTLNLLSSTALASLRGQYLAFNRSIVADSGSKMSRNVDCRTVHSLACRGLKARPGAFKSINNKLIELLLPRAEWLPEEVAGAKKVSQIFWLAEGLRRFCQSADRAPGKPHILAVINSVIGDIPDGVEPEVVEAVKRRRMAAEALLDTYLVPAWKAMAGDPKYWAFDTIVKLFSQDNDAIEAAFEGIDFVMLDEAQDLNGVLREIAFMATRGKRRILIAVGDSQQQIYSFMGAENALDFIDGEEFYLTQSFRFGAALAAKATFILERKPRRPILKPVRGNPRRSTTVTEVDSFHWEPGWTVICRSNAGVLSAAQSAVLGGMRVHIAAFGEILRQIESAVALRENRLGDIKDGTMRQFRTWGDFKDYVKASKDMALTRLMAGIENGELLKTVAKIKAKSVSDEDDADIRLSTAHKAKGREWRKVVLWDDFFHLGFLKWRYERAATPAEKALAIEEYHCLYVAITRAIDELILMPSKRGCSVFWTEFAPPSR